MGADRDESRLLGFGLPKQDGDGLAVEELPGRVRGNLRRLGESRLCLVAHQLRRVRGRHARVHGFREFATAVS